MAEPRADLEGGSGGRALSWSSTARGYLELLPFPAPSREAHAGILDGVGSAWPGEFWQESADERVRRFFETARSAGLTAVSENDGQLAAYEERVETALGMR